MFFELSNNGGGQNTDADFMATFKSVKNAVLVDVRTADEYSGGHIARAVNVDFYNPSFVDNMKALGADKNFFIYCRSGNRSGQAVRALTDAGLSVQDLKGGIGSHPELLR